MKKIAIALSLISTAACKKLNGPDKDERAREVHEQFVYIKDCRTDICYSFWQSGVDDRSVSTSAVACTPKVEALLANRCPTAEAPPR